MILLVSPALADRLSDLEMQVAAQQQQITQLQGQVKLLMAKLGKNRADTGRETPLPETAGLTSGLEHIRKEPRLTFKLKPGWASLSYQTTGPGSQGRMNTGGSAISGEIEGRLTKRVSLNLTTDLFFLHKGASLV